MAEHFSFFDSVLDANGQKDRDYNAQEFTNYFRRLVTTGLMKSAENELKVATSGSNMVTTIDTGVAFILGRYYENDSLLSHKHDTETLGKNRIDRIVIRMDLNTDARHVKSFVKKGVASASPVAPVLTQTPNVYEISLAQIKVIGGQTFINKADVTDERGKDVICPWAGSNIFPNFDDAALEELVNIVENMYALTDGPVAKRPLSNDFNNLKDVGIYAIPNKDAVNSPTNIGGLWSWTVCVISTPVLGYQNQVSQIAEQGSIGDRYWRGFNWVNNTWMPWTPYASKLNNTLTSISTTEGATANAVKQLNDSKANKVQVAPISLVLQNGWTPAYTAVYYKDSLGRVYVYGSIRGGTYTENTTLFTLPSGYIPDGTFYHTAHISDKFVLLWNQDGVFKLVFQLPLIGSLDFNFSFRAK